MTFMDCGRGQGRDCARGRVRNRRRVGASLHAPMPWLLLRTLGLLAWLQLATTMLGLRPAGVALGAAPLNRLEARVLMGGLAPGGGPPGGGAPGGCSVSGGIGDHVVGPVDVALGSGGRVFVLEKDCARVTEGSLTATSTASGGKVVAGGQLGGFLNMLMYPDALHFDEATSHLYIADTGNQRVVRWPVGGAVGELLVAGSGSVLTANGDIHKPSGLFVKDSTLFVVEEINHRVQQFELATCCASPAAATGMTVFGCPELMPLGAPPSICSKGYDITRLRAPTRLFITPGLEFFVADTYNHRVLGFSINGTVSNPDHDFSNYTIDARVVAGTTGIPGCGAEQLRYPTGVAVDADGFVYVADTGNHRVQKFAPGREGGRVALTVAGECCCPRTDGAGTPLGGPATYQLNTPKGIALTSDGAIVIADSGNHRVLKVGGDVLADAPPRALAAACAYGVECAVRLGGYTTAAAANQLLIVRRPPNSTESPCGVFNCSIPRWPGLKNPSAPGGTYLDTYSFGLPEGPPGTSHTALGDYALCFGRNPRTPCVSGRCLEQDNCTNSSSWLCAAEEPFGIMRRIWYGTAGVEVTDLLAWPAYPSAPDATQSLIDFQTPQNIGDDYGQELTGIFIAPMTGHYTFHITSDGNSALYISDDSSNKRAQRVAWISQNEAFMIGGFTYYGYARGPDDWSTHATQSGVVYMEEGELYWMEVLHKESVGNDHLRVGVTLPDGTVFKPIPKSLFESVRCNGELPSGLGVVHNCHGLTTGQYCVARCAGGFSGGQQIFRCDGLGRLNGVNPICWSVNCEEYDVEVGSFFMHGALQSLAARSTPSTPPCLAQAPWCDILSHPGVGGLLGIGVEGSHYGAHEDSNGNLIVADTQRHIVLRLLAGFPEVMAGTGFEGDTLETLRYPAGVYFSGGAVYVADSGNHRVVRWAEGFSTGALVLGVTSVPGDSLMHLRYPAAVYLGLGSDNGTSDNMTLYVFDYGNLRVLRASLDSAGLVDASTVTVVGNGLGAPALGKLLTSLPFFPAWGAGADSFPDGRGNYYLSDYGSHRLVACFRTLKCTLTLCKDADHTAEYGPKCGCFKVRGSCNIAYGTLPGGETPSTKLYLPA